MNLPNYIRTKAEALALAAALFPDAQTALAGLRRRRPDCRLPRYQLDFEIADTLRALFAWLYDDRTRIYKRPRWHLFYDLAHRLLALVDDNARGKMLDLYAEDLDRQHRQRLATVTMTGDGEGI